MIFRKNEERQMTRYLLGEISDKEREHWQQRLLADDELFDRMLSVENDLLDAYACGELPPAQAAQVKARLLGTATQQHKLRVATALSKIARSQAAPSVSMQRWYTPALAACLMLALAAASYFAFQNRRLQQQVISKPSRQPAVESWQAPAPFTFALTAPVRGGAGTAVEISLPAPGTGVRFTIPVDAAEPYAAFSIAVRTASGMPVWSNNGILATGLGPAKFVAASLPAGTLAAGQYEVELMGLAASGVPQPVGYYYFRVLP